MVKKQRLTYFFIGVMLALFASICVCLGVIMSGHVDTTRLVVYSGSAEKVYDGTPLTSDAYGIKGGTLEKGHRLVVLTYGSQTNEGASFNSFDYYIVDEEGNSVTDQYRVIKRPGILIVREEGWIDWEKYKDLKDYLDRNGEADWESAGLDLGGLNLEDLVGKSWDELTDEEKEMLEKLLAGLIAGELGGDGSSGGDGGSGGSGVAGFDKNLQDEGNGFGDEPDRLIFEFYAEKDASYYLRYENFGDYNGRGWEYATEYTKSPVSPMYYTGFALYNSGKDFYQVRVKNAEDNGLYYLPYYGITGITDEVGDIRFNRQASEYPATITDYDYLSDDTPLSLPNELAKYEKTYRTFVRKEYLEIEDHLKNELRSLTWFNSVGKELVRDIQTFVQNSATYNLNFAKFPEGEDMVMYFLTEGREGICQHYAAAATMIYRAYGIPARFTCGYKVNAVANEWTEVTAKYGHAWVEIYVDGLGWVPIEVTGSSYDEARRNTLQISTATLEKVYDGTPFSVDEAIRWEVITGNLQTGHYIVPVVDYYPELIDRVGSYTNDGYSYAIIDDWGNDVSGEYEIVSADYGTLTITARELFIKTASASVEYTGNYIYLVEFEVLEGLALTDNLYISDCTMETEIGVYDNSFVFDVIDENGDSVYDQYVIDYSEGVLEITKIHVDVYTNDYSHVYNGSFAINEEYMLFGNLVYGHTHKAIVGSTVNLIKDIGEGAENEFEIVILDNANNDVTDLYYDVNYNYGWLEVVPIPIYIETESESKDYDGTPLRKEEYHLYGNLLTGHEINVISYASITEIGSVENVMEYTIIDAEGNDVSSYYQVSEYWGTLEVNQITIWITTASDSKIYDGKPLFNVEYTSVGNLLDGHEIRLVGDAVSITKAGIIVNENKYGIYDTATSEEVVGIYNIEYFYNSLEVFKKEISLTTGSGEHVYDGMPFSVESFTVVPDLGDGDYVEELSYSEIIEVGETENILDYVIRNKDNEDVTSCYDITEIWGQLKVFKARIGIITATDEKVYDGTALYNEGYTLTGELLEGHEIRRIGELCSITEPGTIDNVNEYSVFEIGTNDDVSISYDIDYEVGKLTVKAIEITIKNFGKTKTYDGTPLTCIDKEIISGALMVGHELSLASGVSITEVWESPRKNANEYIVIDSQTEQDVSKYYSIKYSNGNLVINPITIEITTPTAKKVYDGTPLYNYEDLTYKGKLLSSHKIEVLDYSQIVEVGEIPNELNCAIVDGEGNVVTEDYYVIKYVLGKLTILDSQGDTGDNEGGSGGTGGDTDDDGGSDGTGGSGGTGGTESDHSGNLATSSGNMMDSYYKLLFTVKSGKAGSLYLRDYSYGDYNGSGFDQANAFESSISPLHYLALALEQAGVESHSIQVTVKDKNAINLLPYYSADGTASNDIEVSYADTFYALLGYSYDYFTDEEISLPFELTAHELEYRQHVYNNYTDIDSSLKSYLLSVFNSKYDLTNKKQLIQDLATKVQNCASYSFGFDFNESLDIIRQFISSKMGICQHYAATATMLYRAYGIPARFTTGFVVHDLNANTITSVYGKNAHAWVEVYIDGMGWIPVEVTGTTSSDSESQPEKPILNISSMPAKKVYDGTPLVCPEYTCSDIDSLHEGHKIVVTDSASITKVGKLSNEIKVIIVDADGNNVSSEYTINMFYSLLEVETREIIVKTESRKVAFGSVQELRGAVEDISVVLSSDQTIGGLVEGHTITATCVGYVNRYGKCENALKDVKIIDKDGKDVTVYYAIQFDYGMLEIG